MIKSFRSLLVLLPAMVLLTFYFHAPNRPFRSSEVPSVNFRGNFGGLPLSFEPNRGQADPSVKYLARGPGYGLFLTGQEAVLILRKNSDRLEPPGYKSLIPKNFESQAVRMRLEGADPAVSWSGAEKLPGISNYFIGNDPRKWRTNIPLYGKVLAKNVYPGIDMVYYGRQGKLEYDFVVNPGADPRKIRLAYEGPRGIHLDGKGNLVLKAGREGVDFQKPLIYQVEGGKRRAVAGRYALRGKAGIAFEVGPYDKDISLVIDPVLIYATYLGGNKNDMGYGIAVDGAGNAYVTGTTQSANFPLQGPYQGALSGTDDAFVTKVNPAGTALVYSTYLGGGGNEGGAAIALDAAGNAYVTGSTDSLNFPTVNAIQPFIAAIDAINVFITKVNPAGTALIYSTYLGGTGGTDEGAGIAVDGAGNAYVTGITDSPNFPLQNPIQGTYPVPSTTNAFITKVNAAGSAWAYSTFLGGPNTPSNSVGDSGAAIAVDGAGNAYVTGIAGSASFPTQNPIQPIQGGETNAFVTKVNAAGTAWVYSTYLGGNYLDGGQGIAVDAAGNAYVTGYTTSNNFPMKNPLYGVYGGNQEGFITKVNAAGTAWVYSTYLGGTGGDWPRAIGVDGAGNVCVGGGTNSADFPLQNPTQAAQGAGFISQVNSGGTALLFSTYIGGAGSLFGLALDGNASVYVTGYTDSSFTTTTGAFQTVFGGGTTMSLSFPMDAYVAKISLATATPTVTSTPTVTGTPTLTATVTATSTPVVDCSKFEVSVNLFHPDQGPVTLQVFSGCLAGDYYLRVYNSAGEHIRTLTLVPASTAITPVTAIWDGKNKYGAPCASGVYLFVFSNPQHSSNRRVLLVR